MLAGEEANGFVTNELDVEKIKNKLFPAIKEGAKKSSKDYQSLERILFIPASYDEDKDKTFDSISFWRGAMIKAFYEVDIHDPRKIEENGQVIGNDTLEKMTLVVSNAEEAIKKLQRYVELGFTEIVMTNSSPDRYKFVKLVAEQIIPAFERI